MFGMNRIVPTVAPKALTRCGKNDMADRLEKALTPVICSLVDKPDKVQIDLTITEGGIAMAEVRCAKSDRSYLIGREGRKADAFREIFNGVCRRGGYRFFMTIVED